MKRRITETILLFLPVLCAINMQVYAASRYTVSISEHGEGATSSGSSTCSSRQKYYQGMTLENVKVKFTQSDTEYYFYITANSSFEFWRNKLLDNSLCQANYYDMPQAILYKTENFGDEMVIEENSKVGFIDYRGNVYTNSSVTINNKEIAYYSSSANVTPTTINSSDHIERNNGDKYFIPKEARVSAMASTYNYKGSTEYPHGTKNNGDGVRIINNSSSKSFTLKAYDSDGNGEKNYIDKASVIIDIKLAVEKSYIDDYRYVCFICSEMGYDYLWQKNDNRTSHGYSLSTNTIDLKVFVTCNHSWSVTDGNATNHTIKCANCEWQKTEAHNYEFEYDGIANDVCICSRVKQVKYHYEINDDYNANVDKLINANSICEKVEVQKKTGYNFKWYEKYELQFDDDDLFSLSTNKISATKVFLNNTTSIDTTTGSRSIYYKAVYSPIKYIFNYSSKASTKDYINLHLNKSISSQTFYYDSKDYLKDNSEYDYLVFKGWTLTEGSNTVDFSSKEEILNYTSIDLSEFTIYPIYEPMEYKILYNTISGKYEGDTQQMSKVYDYYIDEDFLKPKEMGKTETFSHYVDMNGNEFTDMNALRNFIKDDAGDGQTIILFAMSKVMDESVSDEDNNNITPQNYWDLNNKDDITNDTNANSTGADDNIADGNDSIDNNSDTGNNDANSSDANNSDANNDSNDGDANKPNNSVNSNNSNNSNISSDNSIDVIGDTKNITNPDSSNRNNSANVKISLNRSFSSGDGEGGGSNNSPLKIKSFPEDKYTGPGVVNNFAGTTKAEAIISNPQTNNSLYLYNDRQALNELNESESKKTSAKTRIIEKDESDDMMDKKTFGPPYIDFEERVNYRGLHGPWYYEKEYIDRILREKEEQEKKLAREKELILKERQDKSRFKKIIIAIVGVIFIILIIIFEIFNLKQLKNKE